MGKVKISDLHRLLDLVDEASGKTELHISLCFTSFLRKEKYLGVSLAVYEEGFKKDGEFDMRKIYGEDFYVGETLLAKSEPYVKCRDYLINLIKEADNNV